MTRTPPRRRKRAADLPSLDATSDARFVLVKGKVVRVCAVCGTPSCVSCL